jgi:hypothetical protein
MKFATTQKEKLERFHDHKEKWYINDITIYISRCWCSIAISRISTLSSTCCWWWNSWRCWNSCSWLWITILNNEMNTVLKNVWNKKLNFSSLELTFFFPENFLFLYPLKSTNFCEIRIYQTKINETFSRREREKNKINSAQWVN